MPLPMNRPATLRRTAPATQAGSCSGSPSVMPTRPSIRRTMSSRVTALKMAHST